MIAQNKKLVCFGDSIGSNYKLNVRSNTFTDLLARRLGLESCNYSVQAATLGYFLGFLKENEEMIESVRNAEIVIIVCGTNNVFAAGLTAMAEAAGIDPSSWRVLIKTIETLTKSPVKAAKMVAALNSKETRAVAMKGVEEFKRDMSLLVDRVREINSDVRIIAMTLYTMGDITRYPLYKLVARPQSEITGIMNGWMMDNLRQKGVMIADFAETLREYRGPDEISNIKNNDIHLSDSGHILAYQTLYDTLTEHYPEYICEEGPDVIQTRKRKTRAERLQNEEDSGAAVGAADRRSDPSEAIRSIIERVADSEDFVYDENKQLMEMGLSVLETVEIARTVEKEFFGGREIIELPAYDYPPCIRPGFFIDLLNGRTVRSILEHPEDLPRYESAEEKAEIERTDSAVMKLLRKNIYDYLGDDMIRVTADMTFFGDLKMNHVDWYNVLYPAEVELNMRLDPAKSPSPETVTLGEIAEYAENLK